MSSKKSDSKTSKSKENDRINERKNYILSTWRNFLTKIVSKSDLDHGSAIFDMDSESILCSSKACSAIQAVDFIKILSKLDEVSEAAIEDIRVGDKQFHVVINDGKYGLYATKEDLGCSVCKTETLVIVWIHSCADNLGRTLNEDFMKLGDCFRSWEM